MKMTPPTHVSHSIWIIAICLALPMLIGLAGCRSSAERDNEAYEQFLTRHQEKGWVEITPELIEKLKRARERQLAAAPPEPPIEDPSFFEQEEQAFEPGSLNESDFLEGIEVVPGLTLKTMAEKEEDEIEEVIQEKPDPEETPSILVATGKEQPEETTPVDFTGTEEAPENEVDEPAQDDTIDTNETASSEPVEEATDLQEETVPSPAGTEEKEQGVVKKEQELIEEPTTQEGQPKEATAVSEPPPDAPPTSPPITDDPTTKVAVQDDPEASTTPDPGARPQPPSPSSIWEKVVADRTQAEAKEETTGTETNKPASNALELRDISLTDMVRLVARQAGMDIIVPDGLSQKVTLSLRGTDPVVALRSVLSANGFEIIENPPGLYVVRQVSEVESPVDTRAFTMTSIPVDAIQDELNKLLSPEGKIVLNSKTNSFIMLDHRENIALMENFVRLLDVREKQVLVEATIMEIRLENNDQIGMLLNFLDISLDDTTLQYFQDLLPSSSAFTLAVDAKNDPFGGAIQAIATMEALNIVSSPKVATLNGETASIHITERIPYIDSTASTTTQSGGIGNTTVQQVEFEEVGVTLTIRPTIGDDGIIKLKITPSVKELRSFFQGIPVTEERKVETTVLVKDGGTILIGGLLRENSFEVESKVPFFGDIPLIGTFFRQRQRRTEKNELVVLITPKIINTDETAMASEGIKNVDETMKQFKADRFKRAGQLIWP